MDVRATSGIGRHLATLLFRHGYSLILVGRSETGLRDVRKSLLRIPDDEEASSETNNSKGETERDMKTGEEGDASPETQDEESKKQQQKGNC